MTLTIKDSIEAPGTSGTPAQNSEKTPGQSPRPNPVCLEVPVIVRSLPGENNNLPGAADPAREEGRSVIVFDNGGVLRLANPFPPGQTVVLSNQQGREVVCRIVRGRNLPTAKGYIEVEFIEPAADFWRIHQNLEIVGAPLPEPPAASSAALPQPSKDEQPSAPPMPSPPFVSAKEGNTAPSGAPVFEDVADLALTSPLGEPHDFLKDEPAVRTSSLPGKDTLARSLVETANLGSTNRSMSSVSEPVSEKTPTLPTQTAFSAPVQKQLFLNDFTGKGVQISVPSSFAASSRESRGRMLLLLGGAALLLTGFCAGYFFMHRGVAPVATPLSSEVNQPSAPPNDASSDPRSVPASQPVEEQAATQTENPVSPLASAGAGDAGPASSNSQNLRQHADALKAKQPDQAAPGRQPIPNLKLRSPINPGKNLANLPNGSSMVSVDMSSTMAPGEISSGSFGARTDKQPAPPAVIPAPASVQVMQEAKLIHSTRPVYPLIAKNSRIEGHVVVSANIDDKGAIVAAKAVSGPMALRQAAVDAVKQWKYSPAQIDGKPAASQIAIGLEFRLN
jgi:TonB family protein